MKRILNSTTVLIIGIFIVLFGAYQGRLYDEAKNSGYEIEAQIVDVVVREEHDSDMIDYYNTYTVYADYVVDGKEYSHIMVGKYTEPKFVGNTIKVVVNPENPGKKMSEGAFCSSIGMSLIVISILCKEKK